MRTVLDASAYTKHFVQEPGTGVVDQLLSGCSSLAVSAICPPEIVSAVTRRLREGSISLADYEAFRAALNRELPEMTVIAISETVRQRSFLLLEQNVLRAMDALHIACALEWEAELFVTADRRQLAAAEAAGLTVQAVPV